MLEQAISLIREALQSHDVQAKQFILFGSRARGDFRPDSDWDIFVIIDRQLPVEKRRDLVTQIKRILARRRIPNDVVLKSEEQFQALKDYPGSLSFDVAQEGVVL